VYETHRTRKAEKVSQLNEHQACPYIVAGSIYVVEGKRSWTCVRHRRIVCQTHCEECRLVLTRTPGIG
jgi:hypothetical protein